MYKFPCNKTCSYRAAVVALVEERRGHEKKNAAPEPPLLPGGEFQGRPTDFALLKQNYYSCHTCKKPYFGGMKACGAGPVVEEGELVKQHHTPVLNIPQSKQTATI